ncbi:MAG: cupin domain-containing protein [Bacteroidia bacterium]
MYPYNYPHSIKHGGEELIFEKLVNEGGEQKMIVSNRVAPQNGPPFHVHFKQDESLTVKKGRMGYQIDGEEEKFAEKGETVTFTRGQMHRFWNAGEDMLECSGWIKPANSIDYFLTGVYTAMNKTGKPPGDPFDMAYLITRYRSEYDMKVIPGFVKRVIMPITVFFGKIMGKYKHFQDAPAPLK